MIWAVILPAIVLAALFFDDKTPKQALLSAARETLKGLRRLRIPLHALEHAAEQRALEAFSPSPYKRIRSGVAHLPVILNLPTSEGSGEATHPDALFVPGGWGAGGWTWLMSATPYPSGSDFFENPELYVSNDGIRWTQPSEGVNPLARVPAETDRRDLKKEYHSDVSLLLRDGTLCLYYRWSGVSFDGSVENRVYVTTSADGLAWSERALILEERGAVSANGGFLSPSVLFTDGRYVMWTVEQDGGERAVTRRSSGDGVAWSAPEKTSLKADYDLHAPWHLDVIPSDETEGTILILTTAKGRGDRAELHYGFGDREGRNWRVAGKLIEPGYFFEKERVYRSSLVSIGGDAYRLYYSSLGGGKWSVARLGLRLDIDKKTFEYD
jgi:hypothetical protein